MASVTRSRQLSYETLLELERSQQKMDALIRAVQDKQAARFDARDLAFFTRLTRGVIERQITLDYCIDQYSRTRTDRMRLPLKLILRMGVYQLLYMDSVTEAAAVNESVLLAQQKGLAGFRGYVNGVLRTIARERERIPWPSREADVAQSISVCRSTPRWIVERLIARYGVEETDRMLAACQVQRPLTARLTGQPGADALVEAWRAQGVTARRSPYVAEAWHLEDVGSIERLAGYEEGAFFIQDVSSMLAVHAAGIVAGDHVIDLCAAPGGKCLLAAQLAGPEGLVRAYDVSEDKVSRIIENAHRLRVPYVRDAREHDAGAEEKRDAAAARMRLDVRDAREYDARLEGSADVVIADLPCSGLGVMGRKCDIRYRLRPEDISSLQALQREILDVAVRYVRSGGTLLYSTCTVLPEENDENRDWLLRHYPLRPASIEAQLPKALRGQTGEEGYLQLRCGSPEGEPLLDGFYIARFTKTG